MLPEILLIAALTCLLAAYLTYRFSRPTSAFYTLDVPNSRSLHETPTPRAGGVAIVLSIVLGGGAVVAFTGSDTMRLIAPLAALALVAAVGFLDDRTSLTPLPRLAAHAVAAVILVLGGYGFTTIELPGTTISLHPIVGSLASAIFVVWMTNLYNFMDGMDGLAGGMAVVGFGTFAVFGWMGHDNLFFGLNLIIATASAGFLAFNLPKARIFMGDAGAYSLGLLAALFALWGINANLFSPVIAALVFAPFILDATFTLVFRILQRRRIWEAHREHVYQRLAKSGMNTNKILVIELGFMVGCGAMGLVVHRHVAGSHSLALVLASTAFAALAAYTYSRASGHPRT